MTHCLRLYFQGQKFKIIAMKITNKNRLSSFPFAKNNVGMQSMPVSFLLIHDIFFAKLTLEHLVPHRSNMSKERPVLSTETFQTP